MVPQPGFWIIVALAFVRDAGNLGIPEAGIRLGVYLFFF